MLSYLFAKLKKKKEKNQVYVITSTEGEINLISTPGGQKGRLQAAWGMSSPDLLHISNRPLAGCWLSALAVPGPTLIGSKWP